MVLLDAAERKRRAIGVLRVVRASLAARLHEAGVQWEETAHSSVPVPPEAAVDGRTTLSGVAVPRAPAELEALLRNPPARPPQTPESLPASPAGALDALHRGGEVMTSRRRRAGATDLKEGRAKTLPLTHAHTHARACIRVHAHASAASLWRSSPRAASTEWTRAAPRGTCTLRRGRSGNRRMAALRSWGHMAPTGRRSSAAWPSDNTGGLDGATARARAEPSAAPTGCERAFAAGVQVIRWATKSHSHKLP